MDFAGVVRKAENRAEDLAAMMGNAWVETMGGRRVVELGSSMADWMDFYLDKSVVDGTASVLVVKLVG